MPKGKVDDPITDKEIEFAHLVMSGVMTDRQAASAAGLRPANAAYVKAKPRVKAYMKEHRASVRAGLVKHEVKALARFNLTREQVLAKYWELACIDPSAACNIMGQIKALDSIRDTLGWRGPKYDDDPEADGKLDVYEPAWLREQSEKSRN